MATAQETAAIVRDQIFPTYPSLRVEVGADFVFVRGFLPIMDAGNVIDRFEVEIAIPPRYPTFPPKVKEVGGRVPRNKDFHCNDDGTLCLMVEEEYWIDGWSSKTFLNFLDGPVRSFFLYQLAVAEGVPWPHGDRPHGGAGVAAFYRERFGIATIGDAIRCLELTLIREMKGHHPCMCGNGVKIRNCAAECRRLIKEVKEGVPEEVVKRSIEHLRKEALNPQR